MKKQSFARNAARRSLKNVVAAERKLMEPQNSALSVEINWRFK